MAVTDSEMKRLIEKLEALQRQAVHEMFRYSGDCEYYAGSADAYRKALNIARSMVD